MVTETREGRMNVEDIINIIRNANPNITIDNITNRETSSPVVELTAVGNSARGRDMSINDLIRTLREIYPNIVIERIHRGRVLSEEMVERPRQNIPTRRSAYGRR